MTGLVIALGGLGAMVYIGRRIAHKTETGPPRQVSSPSGPVSLPVAPHGWTRPHP